MSLTENSTQQDTGPEGNNSLQERLQALVARTPAASGEETSVSSEQQQLIDEQLRAAQILEQSAATSGNLLDTKVSRRGLLGGLLGGAAALGLAGWGVKTMVDGQNAGQPKNGGETTPSATPVESTPTVEASPLSPEALYAMTPEERLAAVRVEKEYLDDPEAYAKRFAELHAAILNAGNNDAEYQEWNQTFNTDGSGDYGLYIFNTYTQPLLEQLIGAPINTNIHNSPYRQTAYIVGIDVYVRTQLSGNRQPDYYTTECTVDPEVPVKTLDDGSINFVLINKFPATDSLSVALPQVFEPARVEQLEKIMGLREFSWDTTLIKPSYSEASGVQPETMLTKARTQP